MNRYLKVLIFTAIIFLSSFLFKISIGNLYPISLTSGAILLIATYIEPEDSFIVAGFPCALACILNKQGYYAGYVFFIYGLVCLMVSLLKKKEKLKGLHYCFIGFFELASKVIVDIVLYQSDILPQSLLYNGIQVAIALLLVFLYNLVRKSKS